MPFGDQGFCISKTLFHEIGGYPEKAPYGEDLLFVWKAKETGVKLHHVPSKLITSARHYQETGWFKLTLLRGRQVMKLRGQKP
jgi:GT2 family glycosyltransferase